MGDDKQNEANLSGASGGVRCEVCNVRVSSAGLLQIHINGKKHQQLLKVREEQARACRVSLYVTGFKCSETSEDEMAAFFGVYGPVKKIYFDKNKGLFAIVEFENEESVTAMLEKKEPFVFKEKSLKIKKRTFASQKPHSLPEKPGESADNNSKKRKKRHSSETLVTSLLSSEAIKKMNLLPTVSLQMNLLIDEMKLTKEDLHLRSLICAILKEVFQEFVPSCEVALFGSSANGLGCKGSDLDITLLMNTDIETWNIDLEGSTFSKDTEGEGASEKEHKSSKDMHSFVVKVMRNLVPGCSNVIPIYSAKCPVIKFTHQSTGILCDLTINNRLGLQNTNLLKCYMNLDPRISQLVYTVRTWAKVMGVSGGGSGQLTSYALTLMVLYFLQTTEPPAIPSLQNVSGWPIKENTELHVDKQLVDGWECGFYKDVSNLMSSSNTKPVEKLLQEFFDFYGSKFDYGNCAVSIRKGDHCTITSLEEELQEMNAKIKFVDENANAGETKEDCEEAARSVQKKELSSVWKTTPLCVQDPFELTHNLTQNVGISALRDIIQCMMDGQKLCSTFSSLGQLKGSTGDNGIVSLFKHHPRSSKRHKKEGYTFAVCLCDKPESSSSGIIFSSFSSLESFFQGLCHYLETELKMECDVKNSSEENPDNCFSVTCTALANTWTHCRRERRRRHEDQSSTNTSTHTTAREIAPISPDKSSHVECSKDKESADDQGAVNQHDDSPSLVFSLTVHKKKDSILSGVECVVKLEHLGGQGLQTFENFYAFFKKQVAVVFT